MITAVRVPKNNLYANGEVLTFTNGEQLLLRDIETTGGSLTDRYHVLKLGQTLDEVAYLMYNTEVADPSKYWWRIADANQIQNPLELSEYVGTNLLIPNLSRIL